MAKLFGMQTELQRVREVVRGAVRSRGIVARPLAGQMAALSPGDLAVRDSGGAYALYVAMEAAAGATQGQAARLWTVAGAVVTRF